MLENLRTNGLPEPKLEVSGEETRLIFHTHALDPETIGWIQQITSKTLHKANFHQILALAYAEH